MRGKTVLQLSVVEGEFNDKKKCRPHVDFQPTPVELDLRNKKALSTFFTSRVHSAWQYDGKRSVKNTTALLAVPFDFDAGTLTFEQAVERFKCFAGVVYSSTGYTEEHPKLRVILALETPITNPVSFDPLCDWLKAQYPDADPDVFKVSQPLFPCCKYDGGKVTTGFPLFRLSVLRGRPFAFPQEAFKRTKPELTSATENSDDADYLDARRDELAQLLLVPKKAGHRERHCLVIASHSRRCGNSPEATLALINVWNRHNQPRLADDEITRVVNSDIEHQYRFGNEEPSVRAAMAAVPIPEWPTSSKKASPPSADEAEDEKEEQPKQNALQQALSTVRVAFEYNGLRIYDIADLVNNSALVEPPETALLGCAVIGSNNVLAGDSGTGKSTFVRSAIIQEAIQGKRIVWLSNELERRFPWWFQRMWEHMKSGQILWFDTRFLLKDIPDPGQARYDALKTLLSQTKCDYVILDTLLSLLTWIDGSVPGNEDMALWGKKIQMLGDLALQMGATPLILHHTNREGDYALSAGIKNGCDNMWTFERVGGRNENLRNFKVNKTRDGVAAYQVECFPDENYHYRIREAKADDDADTQVKHYPEWAVPLLRMLVAGIPETRKALQQRVNFTRQQMSEFKKRFNIAVVKNGPTEQWQATPEQIAEWRANGLEPEHTAVSDLTNDKEQERA